LGVALGVLPITTHWVTAARLAVPLSIRVPLAGGAMWMYRASDPRPVLAEIGEWLREQYEMLPELPSGRIVHELSRRTRPRRRCAARATVEEAFLISDFPFAHSRPKARSWVRTGLFIEP
jgi:hypothetical protein